MTAPSVPTDMPRRRGPGRNLTLLGIGLALLGIALYALELRLGRLMTPWYMPCLATLGITLLVIALRQSRSVWRWLALALVLLLASAQWMFVLATRLPAYSGPATIGKPLPEFTTIRADGTPFTQRDLEGDQENVLVFFRGRW